MYCGVAFAIVNVPTTTFSIASYLSPAVTLITTWYVPAFVAFSVIVPIGFPCSSSLAYFTVILPIPSFTSSIGVTVAVLDVSGA